LKQIKTLFVYIRKAQALEELHLGIDAGARQMLTKGSTWLFKKGAENG